MVTRIPMSVVGGVRNVEEVVSCGAGHSGQHGTSLTTAFGHQVRGCHQVRVCRSRGNRAVSGHQSRGLPVVVDVEESFEKESEEEIMEVEGTSEGQEVFVPKPADVREGEPFEENPRDENEEEEESLDVPTDVMTQHVSQGHWPYLKSCDSCVQARGRMPARKVKQQRPGEERACTVCADFCFFFRVWHTRFCCWWWSTRA